MQHSERFPVVGPIFTLILNYGLKFLMNHQVKPYQFIYSMTYIKDFTLVRFSRVLKIKLRSKSTWSWNRSIERLSGILESLKQLYALKWSQPLSKRLSAEMIKISQKFSPIFMPNSFNRIVILGAVCAHSSKSTTMKLVWHHGSRISKIKWNVGLNKFVVPIQTWLFSVGPVAMISLVQL